MYKKRVRLFAFAAALILAGCSYAPAEPVPETSSSDKVEETDIREDDKEIINKQEYIYLDPKWQWADMSVINTGCSVLYRALTDRKNIVVGVNAGHGTQGGEEVKVYCHPDKSPKITKGINPAGSLKAVAISLGMTFFDGTTEADVALREAQILKDKLLDAGYDVLMIRAGEDVRLDNVARSVIANNIADCLVAVHWDGDGFKYDKGCFYVPVPDEIKHIEPVRSHWAEHERLGKSLIKGLRHNLCNIYNGQFLPEELTQTCYSTIPATVIELGNAASVHDDETLSHLADGLLSGIELFFENK